MNILACTLGSPGFAFPVIAIARALAVRGHRVEFRTAPWLQPLLREFSHRAAPGFDTSGWHDPGAVAAQLRALDDAHPDVVLTSALALGPLLLGERLGVPVVVLGLLTDLLEVTTPEDGGRAAAFAGAWTRSRAALGLPPAPVERLRGDLYLRRAVPELVTDAHLVGACAWEPEPPPVVRDWLTTARREGARIAYACPARSFGGPGFWQHLPGLPADVRVAASTARLDRPGASPPRGLVGPVVPQDAVLAHADVAIISGSTAAAVGAMARGVPMVVVPDGGEGPAVATLVERAGVGVVLPAREATPAGLGAAFEAALRLDPAPRRAIRDAFARIDGPARAVAWIEAL